MTRRSSGRWTCTKTWWWRARSPRTRSTRWTECRASLLPSSTWSRWAHALTFIYTLLALIPITAHKISFFYFFFLLYCSSDMCVDHSPVDTRVATHVMQGAEDYQTIVRIVQKIILIMKLQIFTEDLLFFKKKCFKCSSKQSWVTLCPGELWGAFFTLVFCKLNI